jgi:hypothetical protein
MRALLFALPFTLLPLSVQAGQHDHGHRHAAPHAPAESAGSLGRHAHGIGELDVALDGNLLELEWRSPAANLLGFEHAPRSDEQRAIVSRVQAQLGEAATLFGIPAAADCRLAESQLDSPLFAAAPSDEHEHEHEHEHEQPAGTHSEVHARYRFTCRQPAALEALDLGELFRRFPATERLQVQQIGPHGQRGSELSPARSRLTL